MALGLPNKRIASRLAIALGTGKANIPGHPARELEARSRTDATAIAEQPSRARLRWPPDGHAPPNEYDMQHCIDASSDTRP